MFGAVGHDDELARFDDHVTIAKAHLHPSADDEEKLVLLFVMMPVELAGEFRQLDLEIVDVARDARIPVIVEGREGGGEVHLVGHRHSSGAIALIAKARSEESRVGKGWVSTCRSRWSRYTSKQKKYQKTKKTNNK